jgi:hypothetical protein
VLLKHERGGAGLPVVSFGSLAVVEE